MEDDTTTTTAVQPETGAEPALPVDGAPTAVAEAPTNSEPSNASTDDNTAPTQPAAPEIDDKLQKYAVSQGLELDSPNAIKAAQIAMKNQAEATRNHQKANELEKATNITQEQLPADATPEETENVRIRNIELRMDIKDWKLSNQDKLALEPEMIKVLADPNKKLLVQEGLLSMDEVYAIAKSKAPDDSATIKSQGKQEALQALAHKQQAAVPTGHATNSAAAPKEKPFSEMTRAEMRTKLGVHKR